jgi:hypothetical protein
MFSYRFHPTSSSIDWIHPVTSFLRQYFQARLTVASCTVLHCLVRMKLDSSVGKVFGSWVSIFFFFFLVCAKSPQWALAFSPTISADERPQTYAFRPRGHWKRLWFLLRRKILFFAAISVMALECTQTPTHVKVKFTLEQDAKDQKRSRGVVLTFLLSRR